MIIGVPRELKDDEYRVALTSAGARELTAAGHEVYVERNAGSGSGVSDDAFVGAGARILDDSDDVWAHADLILKVKEPTAPEYARCGARSGQVLFTYLHLAASRACTDALLRAGNAAIAYETVRMADGSLPILAPMSEVAGRLAPIVGAHHLQRSGRGPGLLISGVSGTRRAEVLVLGAGVAGTNAVQLAVGMGSTVSVIDRSVDQLRRIERIHSRASTLAASTLSIEEACQTADLVIGAVLVAGERAPQLVSDELVSQMQPGSVLIDLAVDQGGCFESSRPTTHSDPVFTVHDSLFYCVANMPGSVPRTSTWALTNSTLPYVLAIAERGWRDAADADESLALGVNVVGGAITCEAVARAHDLGYTPLAEVK